MEHGYVNSLNIDQQKADNSSKESFILGFILFFAVGGLVFLHFSKDNQAVSDEVNPIVIQSSGPVLQASAAPAKSSIKEDVPTRLVVPNKQPEALQPFTFQLQEYTKGATYFMETGDGSKVNFENGKASYTYQKPGSVYLVLYAQFQDQVIEVQRRKQQVAPALVTSGDLDFLDF